MNFYKYFKDLVVHYKQNLLNKMTATDFSNILRNCDEETYSVIVNLWTENRWYQNPQAFVQERISIQQYADTQYRLASEYADKVNEYSEEIQRLREENDSFRTRIDNLEAKNEQLEAQNKHYEQEVVGYELEMQTRKTISESGELEAEAHKMEADTLRYYNENLQNELDELKKDTVEYDYGGEYNTSPKEVCKPISIKFNENVRNWGPTCNSTNNLVKRHVCPTNSRASASTEDTFTDSDDSTWPSGTDDEIPSLEPTKNSDEELTGWTLSDHFVKERNNKNKEKQVKFNDAPDFIPSGAEALKDLSLESSNLNSVSGWAFQ